MLQYTIHDKKANKIDELKTTLAFKIELIFSPPLVLAPEQQSEVKQNPKKEPKSNEDPNAFPFADIRYPFLFQYFHASSQTS